MREEGMLVSDVAFKDGRYIMRFDTVGHAGADEDIYYRFLSDFRIDAGIDIAWCDFEF